jgi:hypothetical protein
MSQRAPNRLLILGFAALVLVVAAPAGADLIHLKNGRTIRATQTEVQGDKLVFSQNGTRAEIPMALVDRIEEQAVLPAAGAAEEASAEGASEAEPPEAVTDTTGETEGEGEVEIPAEQTREYWENAMLAIEREKQELQESLVELRREERAFLFSHRSTAATRAKIDAVNERLKELDTEKDTLRREARRLQIPPGWLRVTLPRDG